MAKEQFNLRLDNELIQSIHESARQQGISATQLVSDVLNAALGRSPQSGQIGISKEQTQNLILQEVSQLAQTFTSKLYELELQSKEEIAQLKAKNVLIDSALRGAKTDGQFYMNKLEAELLTRINNLEKLVEEQSKPKTSNSSSSSKENNQPKQKSLRLSQLADRWNVEEKLIVEHKLDKNFTDWSKQFDPNGIGWRLERGKFVPVEPLPIQQPLEVDEPIEIVSTDSLVIA